MKILVTIMITFWIAEVPAETCVSSPADLIKNSKFQSLTMLVPATGEQGYTNETEGSYLLIQTKTDEIYVSLYTSGLFNLVPILRTYPIQVCNDGDDFFILIGSQKRRERIQQDNHALIIGTGGARGTFHPGTMPISLKRLHQND